MKLIILEDLATCLYCPFCKGSETEEWCSADCTGVSNQYARDVDSTMPRPDWCPLRAGDVVVRMKKAEVPRG